MTTIDEHKKTVKELEDDINEKIRANLLFERQKIIGFATSEASANLLAIYLHKNNLISVGENINHRDFASLKKAERKLSFDFPHKKEILNLMIKQEEFREKLCYGKDKNLELVNEAIKNLNKIKDLIKYE